MEKVKCRGLAVEGTKETLDPKGGYSDDHCMLVVPERVTRSRVELQQHGVDKRRAAEEDNTRSPAGTTTASTPLTKPNKLQILSPLQFNSNSPFPVSSDVLFCDKCCQADVKNENQMCFSAPDSHMLPPSLIPLQDKDDINESDGGGRTSSSGSLLNSLLDATLSSLFVLTWSRLLNKLKYTDSAVVDEKELSANTSRVGDSSSSGYSSRKKYSKWGCSTKSLIIAVYHRIIGISNYTLAVMTAISVAVLIYQLMKLQILIPLLASFCLLCCSVAFLIKLNPQLFPSVFSPSTAGWLNNTTILDIILHGKCISSIVRFLEHIVVAHIFYSPSQRRSYLIDNLPPFACRLLNLKLSDLLPSFLTPKTTTTTAASNNNTVSTEEIHHESQPSKCNTSHPGIHRNFPASETAVSAFPPHNTSSRTEEIRHEELPSVAISKPVVAPPATTHSSNSTTLALVSSPLYHFPSSQLDTSVSCGSVQPNFSHQHCEHLPRSWDSPALLPPLSFGYYSPLSRSIFASLSASRSAKPSSLLYPVPNEGKLEFGQILARAAVNRAINSGVVEKWINTWSRRVFYSFCFLGTFCLLLQKKEIWKVWKRIPWLPVLFLFLAIFVRRMKRKINVHMEKLKAMAATSDKERMKTSPQQD